MKINTASIDSLHLNQWHSNWTWPMGRSSAENANPFSAQSRWCDLCLCMRFILMKMVNNPQMWKLSESFERVLWIVENVFIEFNIASQFGADTRLSRDRPFFGEIGANYPNWFEGNCILVFFTCFQFNWPNWWQRWRWAICVLLLAADAFEIS